MPYFDQRAATCRCEWGVIGHDSLARADVVIVVDVLSFSTCVDVAVSRGAAILPYPWKDDSAEEFAAANHAELAGPRGQTRFSLSPASFADADASLRCVLPSPNGATLAVRAAATGAIVLAGCLRNATAVARAAAALGATFNVCPAGERWPDGTLRPAVEDWLGAGAILRMLPGSKSPEAQAALAAFDAGRATIREWIRASSSGRELIDRGFESDVDFAVHCDVSSAVPWLNDGVFASIEYRTSTPRL